MITLERAGAEDAPALLAAKIDAFSGDVALYGYGPLGYDSLENTLSAICRPEHQYFKIMADGRLAGGICVQEIESGHFHLNSLYILTEYHGAGVGTAAMRLLFELYPEVLRWTAETPYLSFRNHHFYEKLGFAKAGETQPETDGFYLFLYERNG